MKNKMVKKLMTAALVSSILASSGAMTAFAAPSVSGTIGGESVSGQVSTDSNSATARTTCARSATISVDARVDYWWNQTHYYSTASSGVNGGTVAITATKKRGGADVTGGQGTHSVRFDAYFWSDTTQTGDVYANATYL